MYPLNKPVQFKLCLKCLEDIRYAHESMIALLDCMDIILIKFS